MSEAFNHKDASTHIRSYNIRHQAVDLCHNPGGPKLSYAKAAKKLKVSPYYIKRWVRHYQSTGLIGYLDENQGTILTICKKNPNITMPHLKTLLSDMGINMSRSMLQLQLTNLKHIITNPGFIYGSKKHVLEKIKKLTMFSNKLATHSYKMRKEDDENEHGYALPLESIFKEHSYAFMSDSSIVKGIQTNNISKNGLKNKYNSAVKNKTNVIDKRYKVSKCSYDCSLEKRLEKVRSDNARVKFKLSLLREQLIYLCLDSKGPKMSSAEAAKILQLSERLIQRWISQAKNVKCFVDKVHTNKCCGKVQETIVRLYKLNPDLTVAQAKCILEHINIHLSTLRLQRHLNNLKYMLNGPQSQESKESEIIDGLIDEFVISCCNNALAILIDSSYKKVESSNTDDAQLKLPILESSSKILKINNADDTKTKVNDKKVSAISTYDLRSSAKRIQVERNKLQTESTNLFTNCIEESKKNKILNNVNLINKNIENLLHSAAILSDYKKRKRKNEQDFYDSTEIEDEPIDKCYKEQNVVNSLNTDLIHKTDIDIRYKETDYIEMEKKLSDQCSEKQDLIPYENIDKVAEKDIDIADEGKNIIQNKSEDKVSELTVLNNTLVPKLVSNICMEEKLYQDVQVKPLNRSYEKVENSVSEDKCKIRIEISNDDESVENIVYNLDNSKSNENIINQKQRKKLPVCCVTRRIKSNFNSKIATETNSYNVPANNALISSNEFSNYKEKKRKLSDIDNIELNFEPIEESTFLKNDLKLDTNFEIGIKRIDCDKESGISRSIESEDDNCIVIKYWM